MVDGVAGGLTPDQARAAVGWITSDPGRLRRMQEQWTAIAPQAYRKPGSVNDGTNERDLAPLRRDPDVYDRRSYAARGRDSAQGTNR